MFGFLKKAFAPGPARVVRAYVDIANKQLLEAESMAAHLEFGNPGEPTKQAMLSFLKLETERRRMDPELSSLAIGVVADAVKGLRGRGTVREEILDWLLWLELTRSSILVEGVEIPEEGREIVENGSAVNGLFEKVLEIAERIVADAGPAKAG